MEYFSLLSSFIIYIIITAIVFFFPFVFFNKSFTHEKRKEYHLISFSLFFCILIIQIIFISGLASIRNSETIQNSFVVKKYSENVTCEHDYVCGQNCSRDSKGNETCVPVYCKSHMYDVDWIIESKVASVKIDRVDSAGYIKPKFWENAKKGDFFASYKNIENPLLLNKEDNFKVSQDILKKIPHKSLPSYPKINNYYSINHVINSTSYNTQYIKDYLNDNIKIDASKNSYLNIIPIFTYYKDDDYATSLYGKWNGIKPNDILLFYGLDEKNNLRWFKVNTYYNGEDNQKMISDIKTFSIDYIGKPMQNDLFEDNYQYIIKNYKFPDMSKFNHIKEMDSSRNDNHIFILGIILQIILLGYFTIKY